MFKISTNIERDSSEVLDYIVTRNANDVYNRIIYNHGKGQCSFSIIGSFGTGKSTFLWAFEQHLKGIQKFDKPLNGEFKGLKGFDFVRVVGENLSFKYRFCEVFGLQNYSTASNKKVLQEFNRLVEDITRQKHGLVLFVDEFGKHLEFIAKNNPDEMFFIQELAEYCNDVSKKIIFITTLHQNFSVYSRRLSREQRHEWDKVKGRLLSIAFDEPVEQLLHFAAERLRDFQVPPAVKKKYAEGMSALHSSNLLGKALAISSKRLYDLYPLDGLSADILTKALQRYGQNERSLFTFLESSELAEHVSVGKCFHTASCFDYLIKNLSTEIEDGEKNAFKPQWKAAISALERAENLFHSNYSDAADIIKTICLVNIFSPQTAILDEATLNAYAQFILEVDQPEHIVTKLIQNRLIKYSGHRSKLNFIEGTDVDIEQELIDASGHVDAEFDIISRLEHYFKLDIIPAKRIQYLTGSPRFFAFRFLDDIPKQLAEPVGEIDGYINLIFTRRRIEQQLRDFCQQVSPVQIFVLFKEVDEIHQTIYQIEKVNHVLQKYPDDKVATKILLEEKQFKHNKLRELLDDALFRPDAQVKWIWNECIDTNFNERRKIQSQRELNRLLSDACSYTYSDSPVFRNEMVNREYLSTPILTAKKALIKQMIYHGDESCLGFDSKSFPPEKTIYLALLEKTGIHRHKMDMASFHEPSDESFKALWENTMALFDQAVDSKLAISTFYDALSVAPIKMKKGFLEFWIPIVLIIRKEDYSLYSEDGDYIPLLSPEVMDLIYKHPSKYYIKSLSTKGVNQDFMQFYKQLVGYNESNIKGIKSSYITVYGNFLRFYRGLDEYTQKTKNLTKVAIGVREAIASAQDPETALFITIPEALGYHGLGKSDNRLENFLNDLQGAIREIRSSYDQLVDTIERNVAEHIQIQYSDFSDLKEQLFSRFRAVKPNLIANEQLRSFHNRVVSPLDIRNAYWESLCDSALGKKLDRIKDDEVELLIERIKSNFDSLIAYSEVHAIANSDHAIQVSILDNSGNEGMKQTIVVPAKSMAKSKDLEAKIAGLLSDNPSINQLALLNLLQKLMKK